MSSAAAVKIATTNFVVVWEVMTGCMIMHNMTVEDKRDESLHNQGWKFQDELVATYPGITTFEEFLHVHQEIRDQTTYD
jgi:hypothetical protein